MMDENKRGLQEELNKQHLEKDVTVTNEEMDSLEVAEDIERHNENARATAALELEYPRINTDNL